MLRSVNFELLRFVGTGNIDVGTGSYYQKIKWNA